MTASAAEVEAAQKAMGCEQWKPRSKGVPMQCWRHLHEYEAAGWTDRGCPVAVAVADAVMAAAQPRIAAETLREAAAGVATDIGICERWTRGTIAQWLRSRANRSQS